MFFRLLQDLKPSDPANGISNNAFSYSGDGDVKEEPLNDSLNEGGEVKTSTQLDPAEVDRQQMQSFSVDETNASTSAADGDVSKGWYAMYPKPDYDGDKF
jgi:hypothetical protein